MINVGVNITSPGEYDLIGFINDESGSELYCFARNYTFQDVGEIFINLSFKGKNIFEKMLTGNYSISYICIEDSNDNLLDSRIDAYTIPLSLDYLDFEPPVAFPTGLYYDYGLDADSNNYYDFLCIDVQLNITQEGNYVISCGLHDDNKCLVTAYNYSYLESGLWNLTLKYDNSILFYNNYSGSYELRGLTLNKYINDSHHTPIIYSQENTYTLYVTNSYPASDFEAPIAHLEEPIVEYTTDINSNGLFDTLTVELNINNSKLEDYYIEGVIRNSSDSYITSGYNFSNIEEGINQISIEFDGTVLNLYKQNGPYNIEFELFDNNLTFLDKIYDRTSEYNFSDFEPSKSNIINLSLYDFGNDTNSNNLFEYLMIELNVSSDYLSEFLTFNAFLYDMNNSLVSFANQSAYIDDQLRYMSFHFNGTDVWKSQNPLSNYIMTLDIYNLSGGTRVVKLVDIYLTSAYNYLNSKVSIITFLILQISQVASRSECQMLVMIIRVQLLILMVTMFIISGIGEMDPFPVL